MSIQLDTPVMYLKGVGPRRAKDLASRGIETVAALLNHLPFRYEDRIRFTRIAEIAPGQIVTVLAEIAEASLLSFRKGRDSIFHLKVRDGSGVLYGRFFHGGYLAKVLKPGQRLVLHGKADYDPYRPDRTEMLNPEFEILSSGQSADSTEVGRIVPIYEAIGSLTPRVLRRVMYAVLSELNSSASGKVPDWLPARLRSLHGFPSRMEALSYVHFPPANASLEDLNQFRTRAHQRLIFEEFFYFQIAVAMQRKNMRRETGIAFSMREQRIRDAVKRILPFKPTGAQKRVLGEIAGDLERAIPMHRLLEGDVGSGKTLVALETAAIAIENGYQAVLMAPTEILAVQHYLAARRTFAPAAYRIELLVSGMKAAAKRDAIAAIRKGEAQFVVGTHALIEEGVSFARLGLVIVDEQHRFGVLQRKALMEKGAKPHVLVMTATPIPRTLALTLYGDLDVSIIDEMPPGRTPVDTRWIHEPRLPGALGFIRRQVAAGRQAFVIYPVIEESKAELKAATAEYERLSTGEFRGLRVGLLHGRLPSEEKEAIMESFRANRIQILVSTTVVEVGVDVPNATVMLIEHADRFGLSQLHQLRGRIGRGAGKSYCILVSSEKVSDDARERLQTMVATSNGFEIAEKDLVLRGSGEFFGTRQSGNSPFNFADPLRDKQLLEAARLEAFTLAEDAARAAELETLIRALGPSWDKRFHLAMVG
jgi:ATP-dependent DNA helicase RecG